MTTRFTHSVAEAMKFARYMPNFRAVRHIPEDVCIRKTTAYKDVIEMLGTAETFEPSFCVSRCESSFECAMMLKAARAFNREVRELGQHRKAVFY
jgi:hypothetical protein